MHSPSLELRGLQEPRFRNVPAFDISLADEVLDLATVIGRVQIPWQGSTVHDFMGVQPSGKWAAQECALLVARQNGKNGVVENMELGWMVLEPGVQILHTAHEIPAVLESMKKLEALFDGHPELKAMIAKGGIRRRGGEEAITLRNGSRIMFRTRTDTTGRSFSADRLIVDEAMIYTEEHEDALSAVLTTAKNPQTIYLGSAPNFLKQPHSRIWSAIIRRGRKGSPDLAYREFSAAPEMDPGSPEARQAGNPSMGYLTTEGYLRGVYHSMKDRNLDGFKVERLSIPIFPPDEASEHTPVIDMTSWNNGFRPDSLSPPLTPTSALGVSQDWKGEMTAVVAATIAEDGNVWVEVGHTGSPNSKRDAAFLAAAVALQDPIAVVMDDKAPTSVLEPPLLKKGIEPVKTNTAQAGQAHQLLKTMIEEDQIRHAGDERLTTVLEIVEKRDIGKSGAWAFEWDCQLNPAPIVAMALAVWGVVTRGASAKPPAQAPVHEPIRQPQSIPTTGSSTSFLATASF